MEKIKQIPAWLIVIIVIVVIVTIGIIGGNDGSSELKNANNSTNSDNSNNTTNTDNSSKNTVVVADFSNMTKAEINIWCDDNKVDCIINDEYSDLVESGKFVSQSVEKDKIIYEDDKITIVFSLGKEPTTEQRNALKKAQSYAKTLHMSKQGIYDQLTSEYGEVFDAESAQYAIDNLEWDWNANALAKAKSYRDTMNMSKSRIYEQLVSEYGEQFTPEEAQYAIDHLDD